MPGLKRHESLQDLSRDHQQFLLVVRGIRWYLNQDRRALSLTETATSLLTFWNDVGALHLEEEETILLPMCREFGVEERLERIEADHEWLRDHVGRVQDAELVTAEMLAAIADRMHDHVRFEERTFFEGIQQTLTATQLDQIGARLREFRVANDRPVGR